MATVENNISTFSSKAFWISAGTLLLVAAVYLQREKIAELFARAGKQFVVRIARTDSFREIAGPLLSSDEYRPHVKKLIVAEIHDKVARFAASFAPALSQYGALTV